MPDGMSTPEIAAALGVPLSTVDMHIRDAVRLLWRLRVNPNARLLQRAPRRKIRTRPYQRSPAKHPTDAEILAAIVAAHGNKTHAARALGWTRQGINKRLKASAQSAPSPATAPTRPA